MPLVYTDRLKKARKEKGLSYSDMAKLLGYKSKSTYRFVEIGKTPPKLVLMKEVSIVLGKPIDYFFNLEVQKISTKCNLEESV